MFAGVRRLSDVACVFGAIGAAVGVFAEDLFCCSCCFLVVSFVLVFVVVLLTFEVRRWVELFVFCVGSIVQLLGFIVLTVASSPGAERWGLGTRSRYLVCPAL